MASISLPKTRSPCPRLPTGPAHRDETFRALRRVNYDGWLTIEAFGRFLPALAAATRVWRDLFPSSEEVYTQGLRFLTEKWAAAGAFTSH